jgi:hypothetical protein
MKRTVDITLTQTKIRRLTDQCEDTSDIGYGSDEGRPGCIVRGGTGPMFYEEWQEAGEPDRIHDHRDWKFYIPPDNGEEIDSPDYKKYVLQDYKRWQAYNRGEWSYISVSLQTTVLITLNPPFWLTDTVTVVLFGVESDIDEKDFNEVVNELKDELEEKLTAMGFPVEEIEKTLKEAKED